MTPTIEQKPSQSLASPGPLRISTPSRLAASQSNYNDNYSNIDTNSCFSKQRIPKSLASSSSSSSSVTSALAVKRALEIPEIVLLIQEQLDRPSLLTSLRVVTLWHQVGRHLVWQTINWDNTSNDATTAKTIEDKMIENSHRIRTLRCMFHSQAGTSYVDSSVLLRTLLTTTTGAGRGRGEGEGDRVRPRNLRTLSLRGHFSLQSIGSRVVNSIDATTTASLPPAPSAPKYIPFRIPILAHLDIRPSVNSAVDLHLILDTAVGLRTLVIDSHGSFVDSNLDHRTLQPSTTAAGGPQGSEVNGPEYHVYPAHESLVSLKIQHLKMSRQELEGVVARCPNLVEFQSLCSPAILWRTPPGSQQQEQQQQQGYQQQEQKQLSSRKSLVGALAKSCPKIQRFHVGLQQGGFHTDLVHDTLTSFPGLVSFGLPTTDCTRETMDVIKSYQLRYHSSSTTTSFSPPGSRMGGLGLMLPPMKGGAFLTSLTIMNVSSSEKVSQALHEFLCWTPYLKEFYAYNTTLYLEHMQSSEGREEDVETQEASPSVVVMTPSPSATMSSQQEQYSTKRRGSSSSSSNSGSGMVKHSDIYVRESKQESGSKESESEGTRNIRSGVAVCHPNLIDTLVPPSITTSSSSPLLSTPMATPTSSTSCGRQQHKQQQQQQQQRWTCTGLEILAVRFAHLPWRNSTEPPKRSKDTFAFMAGLQKLKRLCIKEGLMLEAGREYEMLTQLKGLEEVVFTTCYPIPIKPADLEWVGALPSSSLLKKVVLRRQKANAILDREMSRWFEERGSGVKLSLQLTDCCEEEYRFS
ncbi:hypothetical protein BGZ47_002250 [Haplosporangium gracile]|nr:hypothetical protein BGZ47_002250 [Haplosporangium gracile]